MRFVSEVEGLCGKHECWGGGLSWREDVHRGLTKRHFSPVTS